MRLFIIIVLISVVYLIFVQGELEKKKRKPTKKKLGNSLTESSSNTNLINFPPYKNQNCSQLQSKLEDNIDGPSTNGNQDIAPFSKELQALSKINNTDFFLSDNNSTAVEQQQSPKKNEELFESLLFSAKTPNTKNVTPLTNNFNAENPPLATYNSESLLNSNMDSTINSTMNSTMNFNMLPLYLQKFSILFESLNKLPSSHFIFLLPLLLEKYLLTFLTFINEFLLEYSLTSQFTAGTLFVIYIFIFFSCIGPFCCNGTAEQNPAVDNLDRNNPSSKKSSKSFTSSSWWSFDKSKKKDSQSKDDKL